METHLQNKFLDVRQKRRDLQQHNLTNQLTDLVAQHLKCCFGCSEMTEQSLWSKRFGIISSQNCLTWLCSQTAGLRLWK